MSLALKMAQAQTRGRYGNQGDPGLGGFLKKAIGVVGNVAGALIPGGGIIKTVGGAILGAAAGSAASGAARQIALPPLPGAGAAPPIQVGPVGINLPFAGPPGVGVTLFGGNQNGGPPPAGYRLNKSSYFLRDGTFVEKGTRWVKARRRNPLNPRAADRAISRLESAKKATTRLNRISIRKKKCCG